MKNNYTPEFKARVALEAIKGEKTTAEIASQYEVHPNLVLNWKKQAQESLPAIFADKRKKDKDKQATEEELYRQIGQLKVELDWLKKKSGLNR